MKSGSDKSPDEETGWKGKEKEFEQHYGPK